MSRSVKDLRELICMSRLSIRQTDSEEEEDFDDYPHDADGVAAHQGRKHDAETLRHASDRDEINNGKKLMSELDNVHPHIEGTKKKSNTIRTNVVRPTNDIVVGRPKSAIGGLRRPTSSNSNAPQMAYSKPNEKALESFDLSMQGSSSCSNDVKQHSDKENSLRHKIENILQYIDASIVSGWLESCNVQLRQISEWLKSGKNFVSLANFLFTEFHYTKRKELLQMEVSFIINELELAFNVGIRDKRIKSNDLTKLLQVVLKEYPKKLLGRKGIFWLIKVLETFGIGKSENFRKILSDVKISTDNKQHIHWLLGMRAFTLVNLLNGIIDFYRNYCKLEAKEETHENSLQPDGSLKYIWLDTAIEYDYLEVFEYLDEGLDFNKEMSNKVVFQSIMHGSIRVLNHFLQKMQNKVNLDTPANSGSTALHVAVNNEKFDVIRILLENGASVNAKNANVDGATALHMAVIAGNEDIVRLLVKHGADRSAKMGDTSPVTPAELAMELGSLSLVKYLT